MVFLGFQESEIFPLMEFSSPRFSLYPGGFADLPSSEYLGHNLPSLSKGIRRIRTPAKIDKIPSTSEYAHWTPVSRVMEKACPPTNMKIIWAPTMIKLTPMKSQLRSIPSKMFSLLSIRRQLFKVSIGYSLNPQHLKHTSTG